MIRAIYYIQVLRLLCLIICIRKIMKTFILHTSKDYFLCIVTFWFACGLYYYPNSHPLIYWGLNYLCFLHMKETPFLSLSKKDLKNLNILSLTYRGKGNQDYILNVTFLTLYARVEYKEFNNQSLYDSSINCVHTWVLECIQKKSMHINFEIPLFSKILKDIL